MDDEYRLERFVAAHDNRDTYGRALGELRAGAKRSHWMWFIFPQITGLGLSAMAQEYAISGLAEARAYLSHPVLGPRLRECASALTALDSKDATEILGPVDAMKLRSSMTLFAEAAGTFEAAGTSGPGDTVFAGVLAQYFGGDRDSATLSRLSAAPRERYSHPGE